ncbi:hypothetical protein F5148DRAFT_1214572 [Russula earlei]|uniref:Uncharacterized protein n=1 Tax=Russula earlei TaxID=71964 RepID=A0ACC0U4Y3_9AGAM|nr:hypothetical protein F5148DRAFT_1214572 [Russula earlei]
MNPHVGDPPSDLPFFHYMTERERINRYSAIKRTTVLASLPGRCPYRARSSPKNSKKLELGWLEFHSPEPPDPQVARPGDVWIQIPLNFDPTAGTPDPSVCRLFVCYSAEGRQWTEWEGDERVHSNVPPVGIHPLVSPALWDGTTKRDAQFYLAFTGSEFTWVNGVRLAIIAGQWRLGRLPGDWMKRLITKHSIDGIPFLQPTAAIAAWAERKTLTASGVLKRKDRKRVSNEPTPELPSTKRWKSGNETSSVGGPQGWHPVSAPPAPPHHEAGTMAYPYSFVSWPHWTVMQSSFPRQSTPPSSDVSDGPMDTPATPPPPNFMLRPATFTLPLSPGNESLPSDDPPPTPPSPVPQLQRPSTEGRPPPAMYPHVSFTPTLSPPRYGERARKRVLRSSPLPIPTQGTQVAVAGSSASGQDSPSASAHSTVDASTCAVSTYVSTPPTTEGRRAPAGAIEAPPGVRGKYAKAGAMQRGWSLYVGDTELLMRFPCDKCKRAGAICSGLDGERCGRCRAIRKPCSHNTQPRPSISKSHPSGSKIVPPALVSTVEQGSVASNAMEKDGMPSRRQAGGLVVGEKIKLKLKLGNIFGTPPGGAAPPLESGRAQDDSPAESQDERDNTVEELMHSDEGKNGTASKNAQEGSVAPATLSSQEPAAVFIPQAAIPDRIFTLHDRGGQTGPHGNAHANTSIASVDEIADACTSSGAPTMAVESLDCEGATIEPGTQRMAGSGEPNDLLNIRSTGPSEIFCHVGPVGRCDPASQTKLYDFLETEITDDTGDIVDDPIPDPVGDPAPNCSQEVCTCAADGAAVGGGSSSAMPAIVRGVSPNVDLRMGHSQKGSSFPPALVSPSHESMHISPRQVVDDGSPSSPEEQMSVDDQIVRFMEIALNGMAQVQDGLRGVFAIQKRRRVVQKKR